MLHIPPSQQLELFRGSLAKQNSSSAQLKYGSHSSVLVQFVILKVIKIWETHEARAKKGCTVWLVFYWFLPRSVSEVSFPFSLSLLLLSYHLISFWVIIIMSVAGVLLRRNISAIASCRGSVRILASPVLCQSVHAHSNFSSFSAGSFPKVDYSAFLHQQQVRSE